MKPLLISIVLTSFSLLLFGQVNSTKLFEKSKGKWPFPIHKYASIYNNENLKRSAAYYFDSTLRLITDSAYSVKAVHDGTIITVIEVEKTFSVIAKFGDYILIYAPLRDLRYSVGEFIKTGYVLGNLVKDPSEQNYTLEVQLYKSEMELRAESWLKW